MIAVGSLAWATVAAGGRAAEPEYRRDVAPILAKYCAGCHNADDLQGELSLESFADLQQGGSRGSAIVPRRADASLLVRVLTGEVEPAMPPEGEPRPTADEVALLRAWIDSGARGPDGEESRFKELTTPHIPPSPDTQAALTSVAISPDGRRLALGGYRRVTLLDATTEQVVATIADLPGKVNAISFSADGSQLVAATGIAGLYGVAAVVDPSTGTIVTQLQGHRDTLYGARFSPDGRTLATCSYDARITLWDVAAAKEIRTLAGHNGPVFDLDLSADAQLLVTASADDTVKVWSVATGERLDTLGQPEGAQSAVAISPDGESLVAGGADRKLRKWRLVSRERPEINPLTISRTAHDRPIVDVVFSPDGQLVVTASEGRDLRLWSAAALTPIHDFEKQSDVVTGIAFTPDGQAFHVSRMDGSWQRYPLPAAASDATVAEQSATDAIAPAAVAAAGEQVVVDEAEPNNAPETANRISTHTMVRGVIAGPADGVAADRDLFRFHAARGQRVVVETNAARQKSPLDSKVSVLDAQGRPAPRVLLQAVRETYFTFRGQDSMTVDDFRLHGWEEMELNEYLYANGEVSKLWLYPRGPDSGFLVYPGTGPRHAFFGTTPIAHALNEPCYIVEPHPPGAALLPNGLPLFTLPYENDDDDRRKLGSDSRLVFVAPADGDYLVQVVDVRDTGGADFKYELTVRPPRPDFNLRVDAADLTVNADSGKEITVTADRIDDFDGEIRVEVGGLPPGFHVASPLVVEAGQMTASAPIVADTDAPPPTPENSKLATWTASAVVEGQLVTKAAAPLGEVKLGDKPKITIRILPSEPSEAKTPPAADGPVELTIQPGTTISAFVVVERNGYDGEIEFGREFSGRNLPHGVFIDNIGLNGLTLLQGESVRQFFIMAAKWVPPSTRHFHLRANVEGNPTSLPVPLHVRPASANVAAQ